MADMLTGLFGGLLYNLLWRMFSTVWGVSVFFKLFEMVLRRELQDDSEESKTVPHEYS